LQVPLASATNRRQNVHDSSLAHVARISVRLCQPTTKGYALDESFVDDEPWYAYGAESTPVRRRRLGAVNQWLIEMSNTLPADHLVVLVTHSNAIRIMLHGLMFNFDDSKHVNMCDNTSVSSILFQTTQPPTQPPKRRPLWSRMAKSTDICFEFYNRVDHLVAVHEMDRLSGERFGHYIFAHPDPIHLALPAALYCSNVTLDQNACSGCPGMWGFRICEQPHIWLRRRVFTLVDTSLPVHYCSTTIHAV
jgi:hypothetical protein